MAWWMWILLGFGLLAGETLTPGGFFVFFFGLSALVVGALAWTEVISSVLAQWLLFSVFSVVSLLLLRPKLVGRFREAGASGGPPREELVGDVAILVDDLEPGGVGKAELRGTQWNVRSHERRTLARGSRCIVEKVDGLTLWIAAPAQDI
ncbi:MAG: NfeD family protein [Candidatus Binatia bacterium]